MTLLIRIPGVFTAPGLPDLGLLGFEDTFTRPDNTSIGRAEEPARPWSVWVTSGETVHGVRDNEGYAARADGVGPAVATVDAQTPDGTLELTAGDSASGAQTGVVFRATNATNYWRFLNVQGAYYRLSKLVDGVVTNLGDSTGISPAPGDKLTVELSGGGIRCLVNGTEVVQLVDAFNSEATRHGFYNNNTAADNSVRDIKFTA